ncbi:MAG: PadR family transcriptional regulator [Candidatus Hadarchaeales archaeon]
MRRIKRKTTLEMLWPYFLRILAEKPMYAYQLKKEVTRRFGFSPQLSAAYRVLHRLEQDGHVTPQWQNEGKPRKYYRLTPKGRELLESFRKYLAELEAKFR